MTDHSNMRLGRKPSQPDPRVPHISKHMMMVQPKPACDWTGAVKVWNCLGNDTIGLCTAAAAYHQIQSWCANNGIDFDPTEAEAIALYTATSDYPKEDDGTTEAQVLQHWASVGVPTSFNTDVITYATLNPVNLDELKLSIEWFGGAYIGVALPISAQVQNEWQVPAGGAIGDGAPGSWGGHAICLLAYDDASFTCISWGKPIKMSYDFVRAYVDEAYSVASRNWLADSGISPPGLNWDGLVADLKTIQA